MNPTKLSFESENLSIHYICFNIQGFIELEDIKKIAFYLFESFSLVFDYNETDISKIVTIRGGSYYLDLLKWIAKHIKRASPMLFLVMVEMRETKAFVPLSPGVNSPPISSQSARQAPKVID